MPLLTGESIKKLYDYIEESKDLSDSRISYVNDSVIILHGGSLEKEQVIYDKDQLINLQKNFTMARKLGMVSKFRVNFSNEIRKKAMDCAYKSSLYFSTVDFVELINLATEYVNKFNYITKKYELYVEIPEVKYHKLTYGQKEKLNKLYKVDYSGVFDLSINFPNELGKDIEVLADKNHSSFLMEYASAKHKKIFQLFTPVTYMKLFRRTIQKEDVKGITETLTKALKRLVVIEIALKERQKLIEDYIGK